MTCRRPYLKFEIWLFEDRLHPATLPDEFGNQGFAIEMKCLDLVGSIFALELRVRQRPPIVFEATGKCHAACEIDPPLLDVVDAAVSLRPLIRRRDNDFALGLDA